MPIKHGQAVARVCFVSQSTFSWLVPTAHHSYATLRFNSNGVLRVGHSPRVRDSSCDSTKDGLETQNKVYSTLQCPRLSIIRF